MYLYRFFLPLVLSITNSSLHQSYIFSRADSPLRSEAIFFATILYSTSSAQDYIQTINKCFFPNPKMSPAANALLFPPLLAAFREKAYYCFFFSFLFSYRPFDKPRRLARNIGTNASAESKHNKRRKTHRQQVIPITTGIQVLQ